MNKKACRRALVDAELSMKDVDGWNAVAKRRLGDVFRGKQMIPEPEIEYDLSSEWTNPNKIFVSIELRDVQREPSGLDRESVDDIVRDILAQELGNLDYKSRQHIDLGSLEVTHFECKK